MRRQRISRPDAQRRQLRWRRIEAVAVGIFLVGELLGTFHFALVHHVVCLEHGEVAHAPEIGGLGDELVASADDGVSGVSARPSGWSQSGTGHQHCLVQALRRDFAARAGVSASLVFDAPRERDVEVGSGARERSALFRLAPKQSPPA